MVQAYTHGEEETMNGVPPILSPDEIFDQVERQYMPIVFDKIKARSVEIANTDGRKEPTYVDIFRSFEEKFEPKSLIGIDKTGDNSIWRENLFLIIVVLMTLGFGLMGLLPYLFSVDVNKLG
jgi:hypothetical protein